jgi:cold shock CspA family protein
MASSRRITVGAKVTFDIVPNRRKESAENLRVK